MARLVTLFVIATSIFAGTLHAETKVGFRQLGSTVPPAVQRGSKSTIKLRSNFTLDGAYKVLMDLPGIEMKFLETKPIEAPRSGRGRPGTPFRFEANVPADQPLGVYEVRVATKTAVSSVSHLLVTDYPVVEEESKENGSRETAQLVDLPAAVCGLCEQAEDVDFYRFAGAAGRQLTFNLYAQRVTAAVHSMQSGDGTYLMDGILTLYGPNGQIVAQNDNFFGGDAFIACTLPENGEYTLEVRDARYIGNTKYVYCVEISDRPFVHAVFPLAIQRGQTVEAEMIGHALGDSSQTSITAAADEPLGWKPLVFETSRGPTIPVDVLVSEYPQIVVGEGHDTLETALELNLPVGVNGRFTEPDQIHYFSFAAQKDRYYLFEVESHGRGLPSDSLLEIFDADGKKLTEADDQRFTKDAKLYFKAPADGTYFVSLSDLHARGGERFVYHLRAEPSGPDFELQGEYYYSQIAPGTRMIWFARLERLNGFDGPVEIIVEGLPTGVTYEPVTIPPGMDHCGIILTAAPDAEIDASLVRVLGKATLPDAEANGREVVRTGHVVCELQSQGGGQARWPIKTQIVGVTGPLDLLSVTATPTEVTLKPGEQAEINVRIERNPAYKDAVTLAMAFDYFNTTFGAQLPPGVTMSKASQARLTGEKLDGKIILEAADGNKKPPPVERLPIAVLARVSITFSITTNYASNPVYLTVPAE